MHPSPSLPDFNSGTYLTEVFLIDLLRANSQRDFETVLASYENKTRFIHWQTLSSFGFKTFLPLYLEATALFPNFKIPPAIRFVIQQRYLMTAIKNEQIKRSMIELAQEFEKAKIDLIFLKGAALLTTIYKDDPGLRPMEDIDCLVKKNDLPQAENILKKLGYREDYEKLSSIKHLKLSRDLFTKHGCHYMYLKGQVCVELHWDITPLKCSPVLLHKLFETSVKAHIDESEIRMLSPEAQVFMACLNYLKDSLALFSSDWACSSEGINKNFYYTIFLLCEIKKILRFYQNNICWNQLPVFTEATHTNYAVLSLLYLSQKIANAQLSEEVSHIINRYGPSKRFQRMCKTIAHTDFVRLFLTRDLLRGFTFLPMFWGHPYRTAKNFYNSLWPYLFVYHKRTYNVIKIIVRILNFMARIIRRFA